MRTAVAPDIDVTAFEMTVTEEIETFATSATFHLGILETFGNDERSETGVLNCPVRNRTMAAYLQDRAVVEGMTMLDMT